jgi:hypothetical protein
MVLEVLVCVWKFLKRVKWIAVDKKYRMIQESMGLSMRLSLNQAAPSNARQQCG